MLPHTHITGSAVYLLKRWKKRHSSFPIELLHRATGWADRKLGHYETAFGAKPLQNRYLLVPKCRIGLLGVQAGQDLATFATFATRLGRLNVALPPHLLCPRCATTFAALVQELRSYLCRSCAVTCAVACAVTCAATCAVTCVGAAQLPV